MSCNRHLDSIVLNFWCRYWNLNCVRNLFLNSLANIDGVRLYFVCVNRNLNGIGLLLGNSRRNRNCVGLLLAIVNSLVDRVRNLFLNCFRNRNLRCLDFCLGDRGRNLVGLSSGLLNRSLNRYFASLGFLARNLLDFGVRFSLCFLARNLVNDGVLFRLRFHAGKILCDGSHFGDLCRNHDGFLYVSYLRTTCCGTSGGHYGTSTSSTSAASCYSSGAATSTISENVTGPQDGSGQPKCIHWAKLHCSLLDEKIKTATRPNVNWVFLLTADKMPVE